MEKIHKEAVRPQPSIRRVRRWMVGDVAEVFDDIHCWRLGKIVKALKNNLFVVRLSGSIQLKEFHESKLRILQDCHKNKLSVIEEVAQIKDSAKKFRQKSAEFSGSLFNSSPLKVKGKDGKRDKKRHLKGVNSNVKKCLPERMVDRRNTSCLGRPFKTVIYCTRGSKEPLVQDVPLFRQVNNVSLRKAQAPERLNEGFDEMEPHTEEATTGYAILPSLCNSSKPLSIEDTDQCSVASCNSNTFCNLLCHNCDKVLRNIYDNSDAESSFPLSSVNIHSIPSVRQKLELDVHELEFYAYRATVRALYASGPLSWEQESLLTNLRVSLNISDEEHLLQLKQLLSSQVL